MNSKQLICGLRDNVKKAYNKELNIIKKLAEASHILRGHVSSMSSIVEDEIAQFILKATSKKWKIFLDSSVSVKRNHKRTQTFRPDLLLLDEKENVKAIFEIKTSMGYYRNAIEVIDKLIDMHTTFIKEHSIQCSFSRKGKNKPLRKDAKYPKGVKCFIITYSDNACDEKYHIQNKKMAQRKGIKHFVLFKGWYDEAEMRYDDILNFIEQLKKLK